MKNIYPLFILLFLGVSCNKAYKDKSAPAYISIESVSIAVKSDEGTASHNITEVAVFVDGKPLGVFGLPATQIPILEEGQHTITVRAGIMKSGVSTNRVEYPFLEPYKIDLDIAQEGKYQISPVFTYYDELNIWQENFESIGISFVEGPGTDTNFVVDNQNAFEGNGSAKAVITTDKNLFVSQSSQSFKFDPAVPVFLEMDYLANEVFVAGVLRYTPQGTLYSPAVYVAPNKTNESGEPQWQKMYVDLSPSIFDLYNTDGTPVFDIYFSMDNNNGSKQAELTIDNLKVIRF